MRKDIYQRVTDSIVAELEHGVRPWLKPWNAEHAAGSITRPLRSNRIPYQGINVLMLWAEALEKGYAAPIWLTFKQALELDGACPQGRAWQPCRLCDKITRTETDEATGEESEHAIPFMKGYTVFNVEQIDGLPEHYYAKPQPRGDARSAHRPRGILLCRDARRHPSRRQPGLLQHQHRPCADAALRSLPRR